MSEPTTAKYIPETVRGLVRLANTKGADEAYNLVTVSNATTWKVPPGWMHAVFVRHLREINEQLAPHGLSCRYHPPSEDWEAKVLIDPFPYDCWCAAPSPDPSHG